MSESLSDLIRCELGELHISSRLLGYHYLMYIIEKVALDPLRIKGITKDLYPETAKLYGTSWTSVEHAIRTAIKVCWDTGGREKLNELARYQIIERPYATEFIAIVAARTSENNLR